MIAIVSLFVVISVSMLVTRVAALILTHTGLAREPARFQARSAFTGVGFTTSEAEKVVNHPVRRRVVLTLMLLGNAGIVTAMSSLMLAFIGDDAGDVPLEYRVGLLALGLTVLWAVVSSRWVDRHLSGLVAWALKRFTDLDVRDYASLMHLGGDYRLAEFSVSSGDWVENRSLGELRLRDEGVVVLGVTRDDDEYRGAPSGDTTLRAGDTLLIYARGKTLEELDERRRGSSGDRAHAEAVAEHDDEVRRDRNG